MSTQTLALFIEVDAAPTAADAIEGVARSIEDQVSHALAARGVTVGDVHHVAVPCDPIVLRHAVKRVLTELVALATEGTDHG